MDMKKAQVENRAIISATDTDSHNLAVVSSSEQHIVDLWNRTRDLKIDEFIDVEFPAITLHLIKVDNGIYNGHVIKREVEDTGDEIPLRFESKTIPEIVSMLEVKEYIPPKPVRDQVNEIQPADEPVEAAPTPIEISPDKGVNIVINIQKSINEINDLIKAASTEKSKGKRESIAKDLCKSLTDNGYSVKEALNIVKKAKNVYDVVDHLPPRTRAGFTNRLNGQNSVYNDIQGILERVEMPESIVTDRDIIKAKKAFSYVVKALSDNRPLHKASSSTYAFFKSRYGAEAMNRIKKNIKKSKNKNPRFGVKLGDLIKSTAPEMIPMKESPHQPDEINPQFVKDPFKVKKG